MPQKYKEIKVDRQTGKPLEGVKPNRIVSIDHFDAENLNIHAKQHGFMYVLEDGEMEKQKDQELREQLFKELENMGHKLTKPIQKNILTENLIKKVEEVKKEQERKNGTK